MIRKTANVILASGAMGVLVVGVWSMKTVGPGLSFTLWRDAQWTLDVAVGEGRMGLFSATPFTGSADDAVPQRWAYLEFGYKCDYFAGASIRVRAVSFPFWYGVLLLAAYPAITWIRGPGRRRRYRREHNWCVKCSYDLTGNTSGICPECGTRVESP